MRLCNESLERFGVTIMTDIVTRLRTLLTEAERERDEAHALWAIDRKRLVEAERLLREARDAAREAIFPEEVDELALLDRIDAALGEK